MKNLIFINGTMGAGKTSVCTELLQMLPKAVFLDGDWCWNMHPFVVTDETKEMVVGNIAHLLGSFLRCSEYQNILFCWVMHEQSIIDEITAALDTSRCRIVKISQLADEPILRHRLSSDVTQGIRAANSIDQGVDMYQALDAIKIEAGNKKVQEIADEICAL